MDYSKLNGRHFYNMVINASNRLEEQKEYVNALNVFPVPDGDTGTNMSMTFRAAAAEIAEMESSSIGEVSKRLAKGALMGARGNSGVILSQIFRGIAKGLENKEEVTAAELAVSLEEGAKSAYKAVMRPTEGTILTIIKAAGESAVKSDEDDVLALMKEICEYSETVLNKTPEMLPVLKKAKVVDAGGMGLLVILKGMYEALSGNIVASIARPVESLPKVQAPVAVVDEQDIKFGYCTEFFIRAEHVDTDAFAKELEPLGDSMVVVGLEDVVKIHIHTNDPGVVLTRALKLGELSKIKIDNMREQHRHVLIDQYSAAEKAAEEESEEEKEYAFIAVAMGEGIDNIFKDLGVDFVVQGGQTMNPSTQDILDCINKLHAKNIFILPNNKNIVMAAEQSKELTEKNVVVIPTRTIPQGITAMTAFNPGSALEENVNMMREAIQKVSTGQVTYAVRETEMDGKVIKEGDILGLVEGKIHTVGQDIYGVCGDIIEGMITEESELVTLFYGLDTDEEKVNVLTGMLEEKYPALDIQCYNGQQPLYYFIASVE